MFFEEDAFDPAVKDYTIYISNEDAVNKSCQSYGAYKDTAPMSTTSRLRRQRKPTLPSSEELAAQAAKLKQLIEVFKLYEEK